MTWAKLDDGFQANPKIRRVWRENRGALGLHVMALSYCSAQETDGYVDAWWVEEKLPRVREREAMTDALVAAALWRPTATGWEIHDFLDYNPSREQCDEMRAAKSDAGRKGAEARWGDDGSSHGTSHGTSHGSSHGTTHNRGNGKAMPRPDPTRPVRTRGSSDLEAASSPGGESKAKRAPRASAEPVGFEEWLAYHAERSGRRIPKLGTASRRKLAGVFAELLVEGYELADFKAATDGVVSDPWRVEHRYDGFDNVLRKTKFADLVENGRRPRPVPQPSQLRRINPRVFDSQATTGGTL